MKNGTQRIAEQTKIGGPSTAELIRPFELTRGRDNVPLAQIASEQQQELDRLVNLVKQSIRRTP